MELDVFSVHDTGPRPVSHGKPISPGTWWIGGVPIDPTDAPCCQHCGPGQDPVHSVL